MGKIDLSLSKAELRNHFKSLLRENAGSELRPDPLSLAQVLAEWIRDQPNCTRIATFSALAEQEPDLRLLHELLPRHSFVYPRVGSENSMDFHLVSNSADLVVGAFGIREPDPLIHPRVLVEDIDLYLCPGLAFGQDGSRLGRGGGFYDRVLEKARSDAACIGVCFPFQKVDSLPCEKHDAFMTHVETGNGVVVVGRDL